MSTRKAFILAVLSTAAALLACAGQPSETGAQRATEGSLSDAVAQARIDRVWLRDADTTARSHEAVYAAMQERQP